MNTKRSKQLLVVGVVMSSLLLARYGLRDKGSFLMGRVVTDNNGQVIQNTLAKLDSDRFTYPHEQYKVVTNVFPSRPDTTPPSKYGITICTQTSLSNLHRVQRLAAIWECQISVAVFCIEREVVDAMYYMLLMQKCSGYVQSKVSFHLVTPSESPSAVRRDLGNNSSQYQELDCSSFPAVVKKHSGENYAVSDIPYPVNVLRNVALMNIKSNYVLNLDIDFVPSIRMKSEMETFLANQNTPGNLKMGYILPAFESNTTVFNALSKSDLKKFVDNGTMRQFTVKKCFTCHQPTNYSRWFSLPYPSPMTVGYTVNYKKTFEPFYIAATRHFPMYDEVFTQYGYNRFSQVGTNHSLR